MRKQQVKKFISKLLLWLCYTIICILAVILLIPLFIGLPIILEKIVVFLEDKEIISLNSKDSYIGFYGAILSGCFTLIGVIMTIKYEKKEKLKENLIIYKPILSFDGVNKKVGCLLREVGIGMGFSSSVSESEIDKERRKEKFFKLIREHNPRYRLLIKNKGRGETFNTILEKIEIVDSNWDKDLHIYSSYSGNLYVGTLLKDEFLGIDVNLPDYLFVPEKMEGGLWYELRTKIHIIYSDMFNKNKYKYTLFIVFKVTVEEFLNEQPYFYKNGFKFAKVHYSIDSVMPERRIYSNSDKEYLHEQEYTLKKYR